MMTFNGNSVKEAAYNTRPLGTPRAVSAKDTLGVASSLRLHWPEYLMEAGQMSLFVFCICSFATLLQHPASPVRHLFISGIVRRALMGLVVGVLAQPEMEKRRSPLVSIPPFGRGFSRHGVFRSDVGWAAQEGVLTPPFIVSMSPPGYPSAWLRPRSARLRFARQDSL